jgi:hypothetical protein
MHIPLPDNPENFITWRNSLRGSKNSIAWQAALLATLNGLHETPKADGRSELSCTELMHTIIDAGYFQTCELSSEEQHALFELANAANKLNYKGNCYHTAAHVREVMLSSIALMDRQEETNRLEFNHLARFLGLLTATGHDNGHYHNRNKPMPITNPYPRESSTVFYALKQHLAKLTPYQQAAFAVAVFATGMPALPSTEDLNNRIGFYRTELKAICPNGNFHAAEHMWLAQLTGMADLLPSLLSPQRLEWGAKKIAAEITANATPNFATCLAITFTQQIQQLPATAGKLGLVINLEELKNSMPHSSQMPRNKGKAGWLSHVTNLGNLSRPSL